MWFSNPTADYTRSIQLENPYGYYERGNVYKRLGNKSRAIADFDEFIRLSDDTELLVEARQEIQSLSK